ncbi:berberine bridge enzyme-like 23 [Phoenix dactylifera]|uniref:Berberine bridge enzyme-like 23 n=1 Tax=Phoenix dactylifera TaxID=42345 RepID=A0A8B7BKC5_PHODC|nr:berberine bridge enzyme-like 23 [Phoenix dactylifera]XP_038986469.1 berberine bridge enzyme-like 23 [Phoenix dactylifera]
MAISALGNLAIIALLLLTATSAITASNTAHEGFLQCFLNHTQSSNASSHLVYAPNTTAYNTVLRSSIQNIRFLYSSTTKKPVLIVTPTNESHVQASVICSRKYGLNIRVRSGGHDYEGMSYVSDHEVFIIVDLANLRSITVDAEHSIAWVQAGATLGELYYTIGVKNKTAAFTAGVCPTVGVGGHLSGGGIGTISRKYGAAADNVIDAQLVDANGSLLNRESMGEDLFWAMRGGGAASFGIVLSYKIKLAYVPPTVTAFNINRNLGQNATYLVSRWQQIAAKFDENLYMRVIAQAVDDSTTGNRTIQAVFNSLFLGTCKELVTLMETSFPELGFEAKDCSGSEMSWLESVLFFAGYSNESANILLDRRPEYNSSFKAKSDFVREPIPETEWEKIWKFLLEPEDEPLVMIMEPFGGRLSEISESAIPFPHRKGNLYIIQYFMRWFQIDPAVTKRHLDWMRKLYGFMTPYVSSHPRAAYLNYKDIDLGRTDKHTTYKDARVWGTKYFKNNFKRLAFVKATVDPGNFFRNEQSIPPLLVL